LSRSLRQGGNLDFEIENSTGWHSSSAGRIIKSMLATLTAIFRRRFLLFLWLAIICAAFSSQPAHAQDLARRLILKDGSYQLATKWEVKGDRVRYYSAERDEWEEVPNDLIDWDATNKYEKDRATGAVPAAIAIDKETAAERATEEDTRSPEIAPNLHLPFDSSVMLFETFKNQPQLDELDQQGGSVDQDEKPSILRSTVDPLASRKQNIQIEGAHSRVQAHVTLPVIYVNLNQDTDQSLPPAAQSAQLPWDRFHIVRVEEKKNKRVIGVVKVSVLGKIDQQENLVATTCEKVAGGWVKVIPTSPLPVGEYAVVEMGDKNQINAYVWDFGVNPAAPENTGVLRPEAPKSPAGR
jgi:hypothetical protein